MNTTAAVDLTIYCITFLVATYLCYEFLIKHKFYKEIHLLSFYVVGIVILILRIITFSLFILYDRTITDARSIQMTLLQNQTMYFKIWLGIIEADKRASISMELYLINKNIKEKN